jgi:hypothetical protein
MVWRSWVGVVEAYTPHGAGDKAALGEQYNVSPANTQDSLWDWRHVLRTYGLLSLEILHRHAVYSMCAPPGKLETSIVRAGCCQIQSGERSADSLPALNLFCQIRVDEDHCPVPAPLHLRPPSCHRAPDDLCRRVFRNFTACGSMPAMLEIKSRSCVKIPGEKESLCG